MKDNKTKVITIAALVIAVIALSIGFAAFSSTLNIQTGANVNPTDTFSVKFSNSDTSLAVPNVLPTNNSTATGDTAVINNNDAHNPVISNLSAHFTAPGEKVEYVFYVRNMGPYDAYLTDVRFNNAESGSSFKKCTATSDNPVSNANAMCEYINFKLELAGLATPLTPSSNFATTVGNNYIVNKSATPESGNTNSKLVKVTIEYPDGSPYADGGFDVSFGSVEMVFATLQGYKPQTPTPAPTEQSNILVGKTFSLETLVSNDDIDSMEIIKNITDATLDMIDMENGEGYITLPYTYNSTNHILSVNDGILEGNVIELSNNILIYFEDMGNIISSNLNVGTTMLTGYSFTSSGNDAYEFTESFGRGILSKSGGSDNSLYYLVDITNGDNGEATIYVWGNKFIVNKENGVYTSFAYEENNPYTLNPPTP